MEFPIEVKAGDIISQANKWPSKWFKTYYIVSADCQSAKPLRRAWFWNSYKGQVDDVSAEDSIPLTYGVNRKVAGDLKFGFSSRNEVCSESQLPTTTPHQ
jgi:hypothetical protein